MVKNSEIFKIHVKSLENDKAIPWTALAALAVKNLELTLIQVDFNSTM